MTNSMYRLISKHDSVKVMENLTTGQKSLYASNSYNLGDIISSFNSRKTFKEPNYLKVQLDDDVHILLEPEYLQYITHSCQPNAFFDTKTLKLIALTKIDSDDELTYIYPSTEWNMQQPFTCICKKAKCLGRIQAVRYLPNEIIPQYRFSDFIQRKLNEEH